MLLPVSLALALALIGLPSLFTCHFAEVKLYVTVLYVYFSIRWSCMCFINGAAYSFMDLDEIV